MGASACRAASAEQLQADLEGRHVRCHGPCRLLAVVRSGASRQRRSGRGWSCVSLGVGGTVGITDGLTEAAEAALTEDLLQLAEHPHG